MEAFPTEDIKLENHQPRFLGPGESPYDIPPDVLKDKSLDRLLDELDRLLQVDNKKIDGQYEILTKPNLRKEIVEIGYSVAKYAHNNDIQDIVLIDRSARPAYITISENWKRMYPNDKAPNIYFMNPKGFRSKEQIAKNLNIVEKDQFNSEYKNDYKKDQIEDIRNENEILDELRNTYPNLFNKTTPILIFDTCIHSGNSLSAIIETFKKADLNIKVGTVTDVNNYSSIKPDLAIIDHTPTGCCYPFDKDRMTEKTYKSIVPLKAINTSHINTSRQIRKEIKMAIGDYYKSRN